MAELKPCPFCGARAFIDVLCDREFILCEHKKTCLIEPSTFSIACVNSIKKQINAWNRRVGEDNG